MSNNIIDEFEGWDSLDALFKEDEPIERSMMESLLYGYYCEKSDDYETVQTVSYELGEWLDLCRKYVELDKENNIIWEFTKKIKDWEEVLCILENLDKIREQDKHLFEEFFTSNFVSCFLYELLLTEYKILTKRNQKKLAKWIQNRKVKPFSQDDFWRVLTCFKREGCGNATYININDMAVEYSQLWRLCCSDPIYISCKDDIQKATFDIYTENKSRSGIELDIMMDDVNRLLDLCDGVIENEWMEKSDFFKSVLDTSNKEFIYRCLKKNVVNQRTAKAGIERALKNQMYEVVPALMLKCHGEWPQKG